MKTEAAFKDSSPIPNLKRAIVFEVDTMLDRSFVVSDTIITNLYLILTLVSCFITISAFEK